MNAFAAAMPLQCFSFQRDGSRLLILLLALIVQSDIVFLESIVSNFQAPVFRESWRVRFNTTASSAPTERQHMYSSRGSRTKVAPGSTSSCAFFGRCAVTGDIQAYWPDDDTWLPAEISDPWHWDLKPQGLGDVLVLQSRASPQSGLSSPFFEATHWL